MGNETPFATAATLDLADNVPPTVFSAVQIAGSANNLTGGSPATVTYQVSFSELMATDAPPQLTLPNAGMSAIWTWTTASRGTFVVTIPAVIDRRGLLSVGGALQ